MNAIQRIISVGIVCMICWNPQVVSIHSDNNHRDGTKWEKTTTATNNNNMLQNSNIHTIRRQNQQQGPKTKIIGGDDANPNRYPYIVSIEKLRAGERIHRCGGSLIVPDIVLTAAHCHNLGLTTAVVGQYNRTAEPGHYGEETFKIKEQIKHPSYTDDKFPFDVMLIKLDGMSSSQTITLNPHPNIPWDGDELTVMGFGTTQVGRSHEVFDTLQCATVNAISNKECEKAKGDKYSYKNRVTEDMMCASDVGEDACQGDSGGPLIIQSESNDPSLDHQVGLVSWGYGCAMTEYPGVYHRVSSSLVWIKTVACELSDSPLVDNIFECDTLLSAAVADDDSTAQHGTAPTMPMPLTGKLTTPFPTPLPMGSNEERTFPITLLVQMDSVPQACMWRIEMSSESLHVIKSYSGMRVQPNEIILETVFVQPNRVYNFVVDDVFGRGSCVNRGMTYYKIYLGKSVDEKISHLNAPFIVGNGNSVQNGKHTFVASVNGLPAPVDMEETLEENSLRFNSTSAPMSFVTLAITFDAFPSEIGWLLEASSEGTPINSPSVELSRQAKNSSYGSYTFEADPSVSKRNERDRFVVAFKEEGSYSAKYAFKTVHEKLYLPFISPGTVRYFTFTITDGSSTGDGLCCEYGPGSYEIYLNETLLLSGDARAKKRESKHFAMSAIVSFPPELASRSAATKERAIQRFGLTLILLVFVTLLAI